MARVGLIKTLPSRKIIVAVPGGNYVTFERQTVLGVEYYSVFFEVTKARNRKNRVIFRAVSVRTKVNKTRTGGQRR